jgi:hypothetical protein
VISLKTANTRRSTKSQGIAYLTAQCSNSGACGRAAAPNTFSEARDARFAQTFARSASYVS